MDETLLFPVLQILEIFIYEYIFLVYERIRRAINWTMKCKNGFKIEVRFG